MKKAYNVTFRVDCYGKNTEFRGFENIKTAGYFEPSWDIALLWHDIFEHWFEDSEYFRTKELSQAGECVALGIREYFYSTYSGLIERFAGYNKIQGCEWNSWKTIIGQVGENLPNSKDEDGNDYAENANQYPNDFNYEHLPQWKKENNFKGLVEAYKEKYYNIPEDLANDIETAYSYGYWLGEQMFSDKIGLIRDFMTNLKYFLEKLNIAQTDIYEAPDYPIHERLLTVQVRQDNIVAEFCGCKITAKQSEETVNKVIKQFLNVFEMEEIYQ